MRFTPFSLLYEQTPYWFVLVRFKFNFPAPFSGLEGSLSSSRGGYDRGCADGRAAEDSSLSDAVGYAANLSASSGSVFQHELDYGYREELQSAAYTGRGSVNFSAGLPTGILLPFFLSARFWRDFSAHILPAMTAIFLVLLKT